MSLLDGCDMEELLRESRLGFWKIEFEEKEGVTPCFYADSVTDELMGTFSRYDSGGAFSVPQSTYSSG